MRTTLPWIGLFAWLLVQGTAPAAAEDQLPCRPDLVPCNYAEHFSGTIHMRSVLKATNPPSESVVDFTATIVAGKATCAGTIEGHGVKGAGRLAVERGTHMEDAPGQPWYEISVACPDVDGRTPSIDAAQMKTYKRKDTSGFKSLTGKTEDEHPDADSVNGVSGTVTLEWSLSRSGDAHP